MDLFINILACLEEEEKQMREKEKKMKNKEAKDGEKFYHSK